MNDKLAKYLRKTTKMMGANDKLPERFLLINSNNGMIINAPRSIRGIYRHLKKQVAYARKQRHGNNSTRTSRPTSS